MTKGVFIVIVMNLFLKHATKVSNASTRQVYCVSEGASTHSFCTNGGKCLVYQKYVVPKRDHRLIYNDNMDNPIKTHRPDHSFLWHHNVINCFLGGSTNNAPARFFI